MDTNTQIAAKNPTIRKPPLTASEKKRLLEHLTYEMDNGKPIYYRGWQEVLSGKKQLEQIMGSSILQSLIVSGIIGFLYNNLPKKLFRIGGNELGLLFEKGSWRAADIAIFEREKLTLIDDHYTSTMPKVVIEVDTKADLEGLGLNNYCQLKTIQLLAQGVERVIWIFTVSKKVMVADNNTKWFITDYNDEIEVIAGYPTFTMQNIIDEM